MIQKKMLGLIAAGALALAVPAMALSTSASRHAATVVPAAASHRTIATHQSAATRVSPVRHKKHSKHHKHSHKHHAHH